jgi:hypothetical protein
MNVEETMEHLFFSCPSATTRWLALGISWNGHYFSMPFFMEVFMIGSWILWKERDDFVFHRRPPNVASWIASFTAEILDHLVRFKTVLHRPIVAWLNSI